MITKKENYFSAEVQDFVRSSFAYLNEDIFGNERLFFENSGGSLRLNEVLKEEVQFAAYPDCPERENRGGKYLQSTIDKGLKDIRRFFNAKNGNIIQSLTASKAMFEMVQTIIENTTGTNIVTTSIEHPSSYDACKMFADKTEKELRVAQANPETGSIDVDAITSLVDEQTSLLSVLLTSNITGAITDIEEIIKQTRKINPNLFIVVDGVQYAPHGVIDVEKWGIDGLNIAPYKMFGNRGMSFAYISDRVASLPHYRLLATDERNWMLGSPMPATFAGFSKIMDYIATIGSFSKQTDDRGELIKEGMAQIHQQEQSLLKRMILGSSKISGIKDIEGVTMHFAEQDIEKKDFIISISFDRMNYRDVVEKYGEKGVIVYERLASNHHSRRILNSLHLDGIIRVSPLHCHTPEDIDKFLTITKEIVSESNK